MEISFGVFGECVMTCVVVVDVCFSLVNHLFAKRSFKNRKKSNQLCMIYKLIRLKEDEETQVLLYSHLLSYK